MNKPHHQGEIHAPVSCRETERKIHDTSSIMSHMAQIATRFINLKIENIDESIGDGIGEIGALLEIDRICTYLFDRDGSGFFRIFQWNTDGVVPRNSVMGLQPTINFPWLMGQITKQDVIVINRLSDLPAEGSATRKLMQDQNIVSALIIPLVWRSGPRNQQFNRLYHEQPLHFQGLLRSTSTDNLGVRFPERHL